jgi:hypothetical protein
MADRIAGDSWRFTPTIKAAHVNAVKPGYGTVIADVTCECGVVSHALYGSDKETVVYCSGCEAILGTVMPGVPGND